MNVANEKLIQQQTVGFADAVQSMINRSCFIDYGIIKKKSEDGSIVTVIISVANKPDDIRVITCVLANIASSNLTIGIMPEIGDKVLVVYPKRFSPDMFDVETVEPIIDDYASGYNLFSGIAIPLNMFRDAQHKNRLICKEEGLTLEIGYDKDNEVNNTILNIAKDGVISLQTVYDKDNKIYKNVLDLAGDGSLKYTVGNNFANIDLTDTENGKIVYSDSNNASVETNSEGIKITDASKNVITTSSSGITVDVNGKAEVKIDNSGNVSIDAKNGKISLKNTMGGSLFDILDGMLQILNTNLATQGSPAAHTVVPGQFTQQKTNLSNLMQ